MDKISYIDCLENCDYDHILSIVKGEHFKQLSLQGMQSFLECDIMEITENELWKYVLKWSEYRNQSYFEAETDTNDINELKSDKSDDDEFNGFQLYLLQQIKHLIRFGLIDKKYFAVEIAENSVLTKNEIIDVLLYYNDPDGGCGQFKTEPRHTFIEYKLRMSSMNNDDNLIGNSFESLMTKDLNNGCETDCGSDNKYAWIEADLCGEYIITRIELAPLCVDGKWSWGQAAEVQAYHLKCNEWHSIRSLSITQRDHTIIYKIVTNKICIKSHGSNYLGVGHLKIIGIKR